MDEIMRDNQPARSAGIDTVATAIPDHIVQLPGTSWALWRCVGLRGAGFPAAPVQKLAAPRSALLADDVLQTQERKQRLSNELLAALRHDLDHVRADERTGLIGAIRQLKLGKLPRPAHLPDSQLETLRQLQHATTQLDQRWATLRSALTTDIAEVSRAIYALAETPQFREAVIWQNRRAFHTALAPLLRKSPDSTPRSSKRRQHEELIASYLQRYCVKNDTIGFFGPVGWATLVDDGPTITMTPGAQILDRRSVYFEAWCIEALAEALTHDKALRVWIKPCRTAFTYIDGTQLYLPARGAIALPPGQAALLRACDGTRTAQELAVTLVCNPANGLKSEAEVYTLLEQFAGRGLISWAYRIPIQPHAERELRRKLGDIQNQPLRQEALDTLRELEARRNDVAAAGGDPVALDLALSELEATFTRLTSTAPTRQSGKTYAGRTLVYEDCRRDLTIDLGPSIVEALGPALALVLTSVRWLTAAIADAYRDGFRKLYAEIAQKTGSTTVEALSLWLRGQALLSLEGPNDIVDRCRAALQDRWAAILALPPGQRQVAYTSEELRQRVQAAFDAPSPGWKLAHYHSPDVMLSAANAAAIEAGDYQFVMGEIHVATNTLGAAFFLEEHPAQETIFQALEADLPGARVVAVPPKHWPGLTTRTQLALHLPRDIFLEAAAHPSYEAERSRTIQIGALVVEDSADSLVVRTRDSRLQFDLLEVFGDILSYLAINAFKLLRPNDHTPRITIDRLIVCRESWSMPAAHIPCEQGEDDAQRFVAMRRWAQRHGMPRFVFIKAPVEAKPLYVDFDSPIYLDIFAKVVHRTIEAGNADARIIISEMLPTPDQLWLRDADQQRYTSELRLVAVDRSRA